MDKQLLKAYIRTIVEEEVNRLLPELLGEAIAEIKGAKKLNETKTAPRAAAPAPTKPKIDRGRLAELMGLDYDRDNGVLSAGMGGSRPTPQTFTVTDPAGNPRQIPADAVAPEVVTALTKDYSQIMKAMKLT